MSELYHWFDLLGVMVFAITGTLIAHSKHMDGFGVLVVKKKGPLPAIGSNGHHKILGPPPRSKERMVPVGIPVSVSNGTPVCAPLRSHGPLSGIPGNKQKEFNR